VFRGKTRRARARDAGANAYADNAIRVNGALSTSFFRLGSGHLDVNVEMVRIGGRFVPDRSICRTGGGFVCRGRAWGVSYVQLREASGNAMSVRFSSLLNEQRMYEVLAANNWTLFERGADR
jgi:hypothetical protein